MSSDPTLDKEYLPLDGMKAFTEACTKLLLGESSLAITQNRVRTEHLPHLLDACCVAFQ